MFIQRKMDDKMLSGFLKFIYKSKLNRQPIEEITHFVNEYCHNNNFNLDEPMKLIDDVYNNNLMPPPRAKRKRKKKMIVNVLDFDGTNVTSTPMVIYI